MSTTKSILHHLLVILCLFFPCTDVLGHGSYLLHDRDLSLVLGGYNKTRLGDICRSISSAIDNEYAEWFRKEIGSIPGNHRVLGHGAPFGESIPYEYLSAVREKYGEEAVQKVIAKQKELSGRYLRRLMEEAGLRRDQARALMVRASNAHLVGDLTMDNRLFNLVRNFDDICKSDINAIHDLFGKVDPTYAKEFERRIKAIQKSGMSVQEKAFAYQKLFAEMRYDEALRRSWGVTLSRSGIEYDIKEAIKRDRLLRDKYVNAETAYYGKNSLVSQKGRVQKLRVGGREITKVDLPVVVDDHELYLRDQYLAKHPDKLKMSNATKGRTLPPKVYKGSKGVSSFIASPLGEGVTAGVLSFAISEGSTIIRYRQGELEDDNFRLETAFNSGKAVVEGSTICVLSSALAEAPFVVSFGTMIIGGIAIEKAGDVVWKAIEREVGDFPGVSEEELFFNVSDDVKKRRAVWDDGFIKDVEQRTRQAKDPMRRGEEEEQWKKGNPFF